MGFPRGCLRQIRPGSNEMGINSPFIYSYETLNDALSSALQNFTNTKTGHKIVTLLSIPISFYIKDEFSFNQSTTEALEPNSTVKTVSVKMKKFKMAD